MTTEIASRSVIRIAAIREVATEASHHSHKMYSLLPPALIHVGELQEFSHSFSVTFFPPVFDSSFLASKIIIKLRERERVKCCNG